MKAMLTGFAAMIVIGGVAWYGLNSAGFSAQDVSASDAVRLD